MDKNYSELNTDGLKKKAVRGAGINVVAGLLGFLFHFASVIILARLLKPEDFGLVAMVAAFSMLPLNFGLNGFTEYIIQKQLIAKNEINAIFWVHVYLMSFLAFCFAAFGFFLVYFYKEPALSGISAALASCFILTALHTTPRALLRREMKFSAIAVGDLSAGILSIALAIAAALVGWGYWAIVIRQVSVAFMIVILAWILCSWRPGIPRELVAAWPGFKYALKVFSNFTLGYLTRSVDKILLGKFHGPATLGTYDRAYYLSSFPIDHLLTPLHSVALATLSRLRDDKVRFSAYYTKAVSMVSFLGTAAAVTLMLTARDIVPLLLGPGWTETGFILMAFCPGIAALLIYGTHSWLHLAMGTPGRWLRWNIFAAIITVIAFVVAAPHGSVAMASAFSTVSYILVMPGIWYAGRPVELKITTLLGCVWPFFVAGVFVAGLGLYLPAAWPFLNDILIGLSPLCRVIITLCIAPVLYAAVVIILQRDFSSIREIVSIIRLMISRKIETDKG